MATELLAKQLLDKMLIENSHVVYTSGRHGSTYLNKDAIYPYVWLMREVGAALAKRYRAAGVTAVVGPTMGGIILSQWVTHSLSFMEDRPAILSLFAERAAGGAFVLRRGQGSLIKDERVLIVEDIITTGGTIHRLVELLHRVGSEAVGVAAIASRGGTTAERLHVPRLETLIELNLESYEAAKCPLCKAAIPINTEVGHGGK